MRNVVCDLEENNLNMELFYMNEKQCRMALNEQTPQPALPDGYYFDEVRGQSILLRSAWEAVGSKCYSLVNHGYA